MVTPQLWFVHGVTGCAPTWQLRGTPQGTVPCCVGALPAGEAHVAIAAVGVGATAGIPVATGLSGALGAWCARLGWGACGWEGAGVQSGHEPNVLFSPAPGQSGVHCSGLAERSIIPRPGHAAPIPCQIGDNGGVRCQLEGPLRVAVHSHRHVGGEGHHPVQRGDELGGLPPLGLLTAVPHPFEVGLT